MDARITIPILKKKGTVKKKKKISRDERQTKYH